MAAAMTPTVSFTAERDVTIESWIRMFGVDPCTTSLVALSDINVNLSERNQARVLPYDQQTVDRYAVAMQAGAVFPPIVLALVGEQLVVMDGNHRRAGSEKAGATHVHAYILNPATTVRTAMTISANAALTGLQTDEVLRREHVVHLSNMGYGVDEVAVMSGTTKWRVRTVRAAQAVIDRAPDKRAARRLDDGHLKTLTAIRNTKVLDAAIGVALESSLTRDEMATMRNAIADAGDEAAQLATINSFRRVVVKPKREGRKASDVARLRSSIGNVLKLSPTVVAIEAGGNPDELKAAVADAIAHLKQIEKAL